MDTESVIRDVVSGVLVVDKPVGMTSHQVVQVIRRGTGIRRAGHTGTLDPRASGVLVVLIGPAVRLSEWVSASDKRYMATIRLGASTDTYDAEGRTTAEAPWEDITEEEFEQILQQFVGEIEQVPPPYSAVRVKGKRAYDLARKGKPVELQPRKIKVYSLELLEWAPPEVVVDVHCSSGTYVRSLAHDIGKALGCGAHLVGLRRTQSGRFTLRDAVPLRRLEEAFRKGEWYRYLIPAADALAEWPLIELEPEEVEKVRHGHRIKPPEGQTFEDGQMVRAVTEQGDLVAVMTYLAEEGELQPKKVFFAS
ncbi:MAG: tRNA pseudouridine(55) synthase TruB [Chloroflexi bacterium]|nr:tRNA pseudouridine(55) synthase TruB [Chloroflexota bacterium]